MLGKDNRFIKNALKLKQKKYRELEGKFLVEGLRFVAEAAVSGKAEYILYSSRFLNLRGHEEILNSEVEKYEVTEDVIKELSDTETPQGVVGIVNKDRFTFEDVKNNFVIITDGVQDPGNLGTIIRTADAGGAGAVVIIKGTVDVYNSKTLRSTMGSIFHIPILFYDSFEEASRDLKDRGYRIFASSLDAEGYIYSCDFKGSTAIVIGNEANGIPEEHLKASTDLIKIPMPGQAESLNAAAAAAVIIYEVVRQRL